MWGLHIAGSCKTKQQLLWISVALFWESYLSSSSKQSHLNTVAGCDAHEIRNVWWTGSLMLIAQQDFLERDGAAVLMRSSWLAHGEQQPPTWVLWWETPVLADESQSREAASTSLVHGIGMRAGQLTLPPRGESSLERLQLSARQHAVTK